MYPPVPLNGSTLTVLRGDTLTVDLTDLGSLAGRVGLWFTAKRSTNDADASAIVQVTEAGGVLVLNGYTPGSSAGGAITVVAEAAGALRITLSADVTATLAELSDGVWDLQIKTAAGVTTLAGGVFKVAGDVTRAV